MMEIRENTNCSEPARKQVATLRINEQIFHIFEGHNIVGRNPHATVTLKSANVSRQHAIITVYSNKHFVSEITSSFNGTYLNEIKLIPLKLYEISDNSLLKFGDVIGTYNVVAHSTDIWVNYNEQDGSQSVYDACTQLMGETNINISLKSPKHDDKRSSSKGNSCEIEQKIDNVCEKRSEVSISDIHEMETQVIISKETNELNVHEMPTQVFEIDGPQSNSFYNSHLEASTDISGIIINQTDLNVSGSDESDSNNSFDLLNTQAITHKKDITDSVDSGSQNKLHTSQLQKRAHRLLDSDHENENESSDNNSDSDIMKTKRKKKIRPILVSSDEESDAKTSNKDNVHNENAKSNARDVYHDIHSDSETDIEKDEAEANTTTKSVIFNDSDLIPPTQEVFPQEKVNFVDQKTKMDSENLKTSVLEELGSASDNFHLHLSCTETEKEIIYSQNIIIQQKNGIPKKASFSPKPSTSSDVGDRFQPIQSSSALSLENQCSNNVCDGRESPNEKTNTPIQQEYSVGEKFHSISAASKEVTSNDDDDDVYLQPTQMCSRLYIENKTVKKVCESHNSKIVIAKDRKTPTEFISEEMGDDIFLQPTQQYIKADISKSSNVQDKQCKKSDYVNEEINNALLKPTHKLKPDDITEEENKVFLEPTQKLAPDNITEEENGVLLEPTQKLRHDDEAEATKDVHLVPTQKIIFNDDISEENNYVFLAPTLQTSLSTCSKSNYINEEDVFMQPTQKIDEDCTDIRKSSDKCDKNLDESGKKKVFLALTLQTSISTCSKSNDINEDVFMQPTQKVDEDYTYKSKSSDKCDENLDESETYKNGDDFMQATQIINHEGVNEKVITELNTNSQSAPKVNMNEKNKLSIEKQLQLMFSSQKEDECFLEPTQVVSYDVSKNGKDKDIVEKAPVKSLCANASENKSDECESQLEVAFSSQNIALNAGVRPENPLASTLNDSGIENKTDEEVLSPQMKSFEELPGTNKNKRIHEEPDIQSLKKKAGSTVSINKKIRGQRKSSRTAQNNITKEASVVEEIDDNLSLDPETTIDFVAVKPSVSDEYTDRNVISTVVKRSKRRLKKDDVTCSIEVGDKTSNDELLIPDNKEQTRSSSRINKFKTVREEIRVNKNENKLSSPCQRDKASCSSEDLANSKANKKRTVCNKMAETYVGNSNKKYKLTTTLHEESVNAKETENNGGSEKDFHTNNNASFNETSTLPVPARSNKRKIETPTNIKSTKSKRVSRRNSNSNEDLVAAVVPKNEKSQRQNLRTKKKLSTDHNKSSDKVDLSEAEHLSLTPTTSNNTSSILSSPSRSKRKQKPKVVFTMFESPEMEMLIKRLGGSLVDSVDECTVLITKCVKRSLKLLSAVGQAKPICSPYWLEECKKANQFLDPSGYIIKDEEAEAKWGFSLKESLTKSSKRKLYVDFTFLISVNEARDVLKGAIESSGGKCVSRAPPKSFKGNFVVVSNEKKKTENLKYKKQIPQTIVVLAEAIFDGVLKQEINFEKYPC